MNKYRRWADHPISGAPDISVVIPTYNEQWRILPTLGAIAAELSAHDQSFEIIVSDDGSTDQTRALVSALQLANVRLLVSPNTGKGGAVRRGVLAARGRYVLFADADQATPIEQIWDLLASMVRNDADVSIGSRGVDGADVAHKSLQRRVMSGGLNLLVRFGMRLPLRDTQCGFKLFTRQAATELFTRQRIDGFSFDLEVLYLARHLGMRTTEVPVTWVDAPGSTVDATKVALRFLKDLVVIRWWSVTGVYRTPRTLTHTPEHLVLPILERTAP